MHQVSWPPLGCVCVRVCFHQSLLNIYLSFRLFPYICSMILDIVTGTYSAGQAPPLISVGRGLEESEPILEGSPKWSPQREAPQAEPQAYEELGGRQPGYGLQPNAAVPEYLELGIAQQPPTPPKVCRCGAVPCVSPPPLQQYRYLTALEQQQQRQQQLLQGGFQQIAPGGGAGDPWMMTNPNQQQQQQQPPFSSPPYSPGYASPRMYY